MPSETLTEIGGPLKLTSPFDLRVGDRTRSGYTVIECGARPMTIGQCLDQREGTFVPEKGDRYFVTFRRPNGTEYGLSGRWDGESGFEIIRNEE